VTAAGWNTSWLRETMAVRRPSLAYLMPDFHNPAGALMPADVRPEVAAIAARHEVTVLVDETMRDLDLREHPQDVPHLAGPAVISIGSVSKLFWGGLRVGWIRASAARIRELQLDPYSGLVAAPPLEQLITAELLRDEAQILPARRAQLRRQRDLLADLLSTSPAWSFSTPPGGLSLWLRLRQLTGQELASRATERGLTIAPGQWFAPDQAMIRHVRIPFTAAEPVLTRAAGILTEIVTNGYPDEL